MLKRILTAAALIPVVVLLIWWGPALLVSGVAAVVLLFALHEFFDLGDRAGLRAYRRWTMLCAVGLMWAQYMQGLEVHSVGSDVELIRHAASVFSSIEFVTTIFIFGAALIGIASRQAIADILPALAVSSAGFLFVAFPFSYLVRILELPENGRQLVLFTLVLIWAGDTLAYFIGRAFGHSHMAPLLSPKKTWEGAAANLAASLIVATFFAHWVHLDALALFAIAGLANIAGQCGDLLESAYKRGAGTKDSGSLLPGHGGMLDRIDSLILAAPVVWWALIWFQHGSRF
ncbi:MAG: phosphatidate cytidylyltransferase [Candidatus Acidiferrales bacterium]